METGATVKTISDKVGLIGCVMTHKKVLATYAW